MAIVILMAICSAYVVVNVLMVHVWFNEQLNFKPFNCKTCLSGWLFLGFYYLPGVRIVGWMTIVMVASVIFNRLINKL